MPRKHYDIRTYPYAILNSRGLSRRVGYLAAQQRRAYNQAVDWLNREPGLSDVVNSTKGIRPERSLCGRITKWWDKEKKAQAPRWVLDAGVKLAHRANHLMRFKRRERLDEIERIEDMRANWAASPPTTKQDWDELDKADRKMARLMRPHRRTLQHRSRKKGTQTLEIDNNEKFYVRADRCAIVAKDKSYGFVIPLAKPLPDTVSTDQKPSPAHPDVVRSLRLVEVRGKRRDLRNRRLEDIRYEVHIAIGGPEVPLTRPEGVALDGIIGIDVGVKKSWAASTGEVFQHEGKWGTDEAYARPKTMQKAIGRKPKNSRRRRKAEYQRRELLRKRKADRRRAFNGHARMILDAPGVKAIAIEGLNIPAMMASAKGGANAPGKQEAQKHGLNYALSKAAISDSLAILKNQAVKRGVPVLTVDSRGTSQTCSLCGYRSRSNRKSQAVFICGQCRCQGNADINAAVIIRNRGYCRYVDSEVFVDVAPTGWRNQPSRSGQGVLFWTKAPSTLTEAARGQMPRVRVLGARVANTGKTGDCDRRRKKGGTGTLVPQSTLQLGFPGFA